MQEQLQEQGHNEVPYEYIIQLMDIILHNNIFILQNALWKQEVGAAMSSTLLYIERENNQLQVIVRFARLYATFFFLDSLLLKLLFSVNHFCN